MNALIVFAKNPLQPGVKTRLARDLGDETARRIAMVLTKHVRDEATAVNCRRFAFLDGPEYDPAWSDAVFEIHRQHGSDLGERMANAFEVAFDGGCKKVVMVGTDLPDLSADIINAAFDRLSDHDYVIGPALDGGYYLIGMRAMNRAVFRHISWSSSLVLDQTLERVRELQASVTLLPSLTDVDTAEDLAKVRNQNLLAQLQATV